MFREHADEWSRLVLDADLQDAQDINLAIGLARAGE